MVYPGQRGRSQLKSDDPIGAMLIYGRTTGEANGLFLLDNYFEGSVETVEENEIPTFVARRNYIRTGRWVGFLLKHNYRSVEIKHNFIVAAEFGVRLLQERSQTTAADRVERRCREAPGRTTPRREHLRGLPRRVPGRRGDDLSPQLPEVQQSQGAHPAPRASDGVDGGSEDPAGGGGRDRRAVTPGGRAGAGPATTFKRGLGPSRLGPVVSLGREGDRPAGWPPTAFPIP